MRRDHRLLQGRDCLGERDCRIGCVGRVNKRRAIGDRLRRGSVDHDADCRVLGADKGTDVLGHAGREILRLVDVELATQLLDLCADHGAKVCVLLLEQFDVRRAIARVCLDHRVSLGRLGSARLLALLQELGGEYDASHRHQGLHLVVVLGNHGRCLLFTNEKIEFEGRNDSGQRHTRRYLHSLNVKTVVLC